MTLSKTLFGLIVAALAATIALRPALGDEMLKGRRVVIEIRQFAFVPKSPLVSPGDIVVWKNLDIVPHTVTSQHESWDSGKIEAGGEWQTVITEEMALAFYCKFHPSMVAALEIESD